MTRFLHFGGLMNRIAAYLFLGTTVILAFFACRSIHNATKQKEVLPTVDSRSLFMSKIEELFPLLPKEKHTLQYALHKVNESVLGTWSFVFDKLCKDDQSCKLVVPFQRIPSTMQVSKEYKLMGCAAYTLGDPLISTLINLVDNRRNEKMDTLSEKDSTFANSSSTPLVYSSRDDYQDRTHKKFEDIYKFLVIREPMENLLTGFSDICLGQRNCSGCSTLDCVLEMILRGTDDPNNENVFTGRSMDWLKNLRTHFLPQRWRCSIYGYFFRYRLIRYSPLEPTDMEREMKDLLNTQKVPQSHINYITSQMFSENSGIFAKKRGPFGTMKNLLSKVGAEKFLRVFFFDYVIFGIPIPKEMISLMIE